jgi:hypothetical protein
MKQHRDCKSLPEEKPEKRPIAIPTWRGFDYDDDYDNDNDEKLVKSRHPVGERGPGLLQLPGITGWRFIPIESGPE